MRFGDEPARALSVFVCLLAAPWPGAAAAQVAGSEFFGTARDAAGSVVPGAQILVVSEAQGFQYRTTTDEAGFYSVPNLIPGLYRLEASKDGFAPQTRPGVLAVSGKRVEVGLELGVGATSGSVEVRADAPLLESGTSDVGQATDNRRVVELPLNGRSYLQLATLAAYTVPLETGSRQGPASCSGAPGSTPTTSTSTASTPTPSSSTGTWPAPHSTASPSSAC